MKKLFALSCFIIAMGTLSAVSELEMAVLRGKDAECVRKLVDRNIGAVANPGTGGMFLLEWAALSTGPKAIEIFQLLVEFYGADPCVTLPRRRTLLHTAAGGAKHAFQGGSSKSSEMRAGIVRVLKDKHGLDINAEDEFGVTPLGYALFRGWQEEDLRFPVLETLLDLGATRPIGEEDVAAMIAKLLSRGDGDDVRDVVTEAMGRYREEPRVRERLRL